MPPGRPSSYTPEIGNAICLRLSNGESLRTICKSEGMPDKQTVLRWVESFPDFRDHYARARIEQADHYAEEIIDIADQEPASGEYGMDSAAVQHARVRIDARKWYASKVAPKRYGDRQEIEHSGTVSLEQLVSGNESG